MIARSLKADLLVSLHINSSSSSTANGAEVYVTANTSLPKYNYETSKLASKVLENLEELGIRNRGVLTKQLERDKTDIYSDGTMADYYGIIRYAMRGTKIDDGILTPEGAVSANIQNGEGIPTILIEHCFINGNDYKFVDSDDDIAKLARADANAIISHYQLTKINSEKVTINNLKEENGMLTKIPEKTEKTEFSNNFIISDSLYVEVKGNSDYIGTGTTVNIIHKESGAVINTYTCMIFGDTNGDGKVSSADYVLTKNHIMETMQLDGIYKQVADVNRDNKISASDYVLIKNHIMNGTELKIE